MFDNAAYHRSNKIRQFYNDAHIPVMFLGPYQFGLAPVEMMFSYIKSRNLNVLNTNISNKYLLQLTLLEST